MNDQPDAPARELARQIVQKFTEVPLKFFHSQKYGCSTATSVEYPIEEWEQIVVSCLQPLMEQVETLRTESAGWQSRSYAMERQLADTGISEPDFTAAGDAMSADPPQIVREFIEAANGYFLHSELHGAGDIVFSSEFLRCRNALTEALVAAPPVGRDWQPIETAPKEEGWFLAASKDKVHIACRADGEILDVGAEMDTGEIGLYEPAYPFTHWMPLPDPPGAVSAERPQPSAQQEP